MKDTDTRFHQNTKKKHTIKQTNICVTDYIHVKTQLFSCGPFHYGRINCDKIKIQNSRNITILVRINAFSPNELLINFVCDFLILHI